MNSGQMPFVPMFPNGGMPFNGIGGGQPYDPHDSRMDVRPNGGGTGPGARPPRAPVIPRDKIESGDGAGLRSGELPVIQDLTPRDPNEDNSLRSNGASIPNGAPGPSSGGITNGMGHAMESHQVKTDLDVDMGLPSAPLPMPNNHHNHPQARGYRPRRGGGRGNNRAGTFPAEVHSETS